jgi:hypothetical protein
VADDNDQYDAPLGRHDAPADEGQKPDADEEEPNIAYAADEQEEKIEAKRPRVDEEDRSDEKADDAAAEQEEKGRRNVENNDQYDSADQIEGRRANVGDNGQYDATVADAAEGRRDNVQDDDQYNARADDQENKIAAPNQYGADAAEDENDGDGRRARDLYDIADRQAHEYGEKDVAQKRFEFPPRDPYYVAHGRAPDGSLRRQDAPCHEDEASDGRGGYDGLKGKVGGKLLPVDPEDEVAPGQGDEVDAAGGGGGEVDAGNERIDLNEIVHEADELAKENARKKRDRDIDGVARDDVNGDEQKREAGEAEVAQDDEQLGGEVADARDNIEPPVGDRRQIGAEYLSNDDPDEVKHDKPNERRHRRVAQGDYKPEIDRIPADYEEDGGRRGKDENVGVGADELVPKPGSKPQQDDDERNDIIGHRDEPPLEEGEQREIAQPYSKPQPQDEQQDEVTEPPYRRRKEEEQYQLEAPSYEQQPQENEGEIMVPPYKRQQEDGQGEQVAPGHKQQHQPPEEDEGEQVAPGNEQQ